jgi:hypothetical protein
MAGVGLGIILVPQLTRYLIEAYGWRNAYVGLGRFCSRLHFLQLLCWCANRISRTGRCLLMLGRSRVLASGKL